MAEELGKIEKPPVEKFKAGRKLYFVPLLFGSEVLPKDYLEKVERYWQQVKKQLNELSAKLGGAVKVYHELITVSGEPADKAIREINERGHTVIKSLISEVSQLQALEDNDILTEFMDWSRCLMIGLQNPRVNTRVYEFYTEAGKKRNEYVARKIDETLGENEIGLLMMRENHRVQFPADIQVFYVAPPALDEIKRWMREQEAAAERSTPEKESGD